MTVAEPGPEATPPDVDSDVTRTTDVDATPAPRIGTGMQADDDGTTRVRVVIAMLTYLRPEGLEDALPRLIDQADTVEDDVSILIIDNDPAGSAMETGRSLATERIRFVHEPTPGIAAARNRALAESGEERLLIFIDDDELPQRGWLMALLDTWRDGHPTAVVGPVVSTYPPDPDPWIIAGGFFDRRRMPTGTHTTVAATNNLLLDMDQIRRMGLSFDERFGITGGSDTMFSVELVERGGSIVWCDEALVIDVVPVERMTREWVLRRRFRMGNVMSRVSLRTRTSSTQRLAARLRLTAHGSARVLVGSIRFAMGTLLRSLSHRANGARTTAHGLGITTGAWGFVYSEYKRKRAS